jgi:hypothetical protein
MSDTNFKLYWIFYQHRKYAQYQTNTSVHSSHKERPKYPISTKGTHWIPTQFKSKHQELLTLTEHRSSSLFYACLCWVGDGQFVELHVFMFLVPRKKDFLFVFTPICFVGCSCFINVICIVYWLPKHIQYHNMFLWFNSNTTVVTSGARSANLSRTHPLSLRIEVVFVLLHIVQFLLIIVLSVIWLTVSAYPFVIFKLFDNANKVKNTELLKYSISKNI